MVDIGVDPDCYVLATKFLVDALTRDEVSTASIERNTKSLAESIQQAVEDWFAAQNWEPQ